MRQSREEGEEWSSFISNPYEEARLKDASYTWRIGYYHYVGICDHYGVAP